ncbi:MAG: hypothetical protein CVV42_11350 [Candidatus Riflebacteria bacterium HGW-Riflebacteria-2]|jgi:hypothetical protein|nr:MAG: hypothetical protein CVV42_11350 [Candidatus Riflebacteria bacterium HGW-Riflebacteria-2]
MVLRTLLIIILFSCSGIVSACDPNSLPEEIFTTLYTPAISPGVVVLAANMVMMSGLSLPATWESVITGDSDDNGCELNAQLFRAVLPAFGSLTDNMHDNLAGRVILKISPVLVRAFRDALQSGAWQTLVIQISVPISGKVVVYRKSGKIEFIDEIDSTLNFSLTSAWPPVQFKHLRIWGRQGMVFAWPEEDTVLSEGVASAQ